MSSINEATPTEAEQQSVLPIAGPSSQNPISKENDVEKTAADESSENEEMHSELSSSNNADKDSHINCVDFDYT